MKNIASPSFAGIPDVTGVPVLDETTPARVLDGVAGIVFDCDGVLFDSWNANKEYYNYILQEVGCAPMTADQECYVHAHAVMESVHYITPPELLEKAHAVREKLSYDQFIPHMVPEPGLAAMLAALQDSGLRVGICTNRTSTMEQILQIFNLAEFFSPVVTASDVAPKPSPEGLQRVVSQWGVQASAIIFIGDTQVDASAASAAHVRFWAYKNTKLVCEYQVNDFACIEKLVQNKAATP